MINYAADHLLVVILRNESTLNDTPFICKIAVGSLRDLLRRLNFMPKMPPNQLGKWISKSHSFFFFLPLKKFYWGIVDLQCVSFKYTVN